MINKKSTIYALAGIILSLNALMQARPFDFMRPENEREDRSAPREDSGFMQEKVYNREGQQETKFAPLEPVRGLFGSRRYNDGSYKYNDYSNE